MEDRVPKTFSFLYNKLETLTKGLIEAMCGRFTLYSSLSKLKKSFEIDKVTCEIKPSYNIAPGHEIYAIIRKNENRLGKLHWGLVPAWAKDLSGASRLINARSETLHEKPSFKKALENRRCLITADGFYEWKEKQPWYCAPSGSGMLAFAGLWETWKKDGSVYHSCTIITTKAVEVMNEIHDRMPLILKPEIIKEWLNPALREYKDLEMVLKHGGVKEIKVYPVSKFVNSPKNNDPRCIEPVSE